MPILPIPFCDYVTVSLPADSGQPCIDAVLEWITQAGGATEYPGVVRLGATGTVHYRERHRVLTLSFSGGALGALREARLLGEVLHTIGAHAHRVTTLHAALDVATDAAPVLEEVYQRFRSGEGHLTQKRVQARSVTRVWGPGLPDGKETGTVYLGKRGAGVWAKVYDKRSQLLSAELERLPAKLRDCVELLTDPGPLMRAEISLGRNLGCTLRDVADPSAVFWAHVGSLAAYLPSKPTDVPDWFALGEGFDLGPRAERLPWQQLTLLLERSHDVAKVAQLLHELGPAARTMFLSRLDRVGRVPRPVVSVVAA